jgi:hypothetical protein
MTTPVREALRDRKNSVCLKGILREFTPHKKEVPKRGHFDGVLRKGGALYSSQIKVVYLGKIQ